MENSNQYKGWYRESQKRTQPYMMLIERQDETGRSSFVPYERLQGVLIDAYSPEQAWFLFKKNYPSLISDQQEMGSRMRVEVDEETVREREQIREYQEQRKQEAIQNAWWNND